MSNTYRRVFKPKAFSGSLTQRKLNAFATRRLTRFSAFMANRPRRYIPLKSTGEKKVIDQAVAAYQVNTSGSFTLLNGCVQGSDYTNRIGRKTVNKSVYIRGYVTYESTAGAVSLIAQQARMILFIDNQPNGSAPAVTDLLNSASSASQLNLNNRDRFRIIADETFVINPASFAAAGVLTAGSGELIRDVNCYRKLGLETIFNANNNGNITDISSGALYMFWIGSVAAGTGTDLNAGVSVRVRFLDP